MPEEWEYQQRDFEVRNKVEEDSRHLVLEEEKEYSLLKNQLIEIQLTAE